MTAAPEPPDTLALPAVPVRSPRTSLVLAELARQRRFERRDRRVKRQQRCRAWTGWLAVLGLELCKPSAVQSVPTPCRSGATRLDGAV
ncbi:MAG TPA: hypothetical protein VGD78_14010 [Chthoniobacterales bacterium]